MKIQTIHPNKPEDFNTAIDLLNEVFAEYGQEVDYTSQGAFEKTKDSKDKLILLATENDDYVGFCLVYERLPGYLHIWQMGVLEEHRGKGIASQFYELTENFAKDHGYEGVTINTFNKFKANLRLAVTRGYKIYDIEKYESEPDEPKLKLKLEF